uniref:DUF4408 domain-containing protein n=1 Tax=Davidia involucrata TaxID=16924 RepID=A0A5B6ZSH2_DAVIN
MDSFNISKVKIEKANAILRYHRLQKITNLFRLIELCIVLIVISRFSSQLPVAFKLSGEYFRGLSVALISPRFVFVVGNLIVIILFMKSGKFSTQEEIGNKSNIDLCDEYAVSSEKNRNIHREESEHQRKQDKDEDEEDTIMVNMYSSREKKIDRSHSEELKREHCEKARRELKRSVSESSRKSVNDSEKVAARSYMEDDMSSEEFRRTVEAFIARQQRFLREE